jgi:hypothetical protein
VFKAFVIFLYLISLFSLFFLLPLPQVFFFNVLGTRGCQKFKSVEKFSFDQDEHQLSPFTGRNTKWLGHFGK